MRSREFPESLNKTCFKDKKEERTLLYSQLKCCFLLDESVSRGGRENDSLGRTKLANSIGRQQLKLEGFDLDAFKKIGSL